MAGTQQGTTASAGAEDERFRRPLESPLIVLLPLIFALLLLRGFGLELFRVDGVSMRPAVETGDTLFVNRAAYGLQLPFVDVYLVAWSTPEVDDIIVFRDPDTGRLSVKRVIATGGDTYELTGAGVRFRGYPDVLPVSIPVAEEMRKSNRLEKRDTFVLGDNRTRSVDSRRYGPVNVTHVRGRVLDIGDAGCVVCGSNRQ